jgi:toxin ParE1/3/4
LKVVFSNNAEQDLEAIGDWIAQENPERAYSFVNDLRNHCNRLGGFSERNPVFKISKLGELRKRTFGNYLIFYILKDNTVNIARILHGARDFSELL